METVVIVAIGVLATIFLASFAALVVVCRQRYCRPRDLLQRYDSKPIVDLIGAMETQSEPSELELDDVVITNPHIEAILENEDWIEDASGLMSHCIAILKICHTLTEKLVAMTMGSGAKMKTSASVSDIIVVAKRISPSDLVAGVCTVDQLPVSVLSPPAPRPIQGPASSLRDRVGGEDIIQIYQIPGCLQNTMWEARSRIVVNSSTPSFGLDLVKKIKPFSLREGWY
ncbi:Transmembrane protein 98, partial [Eschrichtius robustus]|nr:Transmembrane protein 98 [Eschrichtius robustus]